MPTSAIRRGVLVAATLLACPAVAIAQPIRRPTRVLLVYQQQAEARSMLEFTQRLRLTLENKLASPLEFYQEALDVDRFRELDRSRPLARYFTEKYEGHGIDVIVPVGRAAFQFTVDHLRGVFPDVPVVFALGAAPRGAMPDYVTGRFAAVSRFEPTLSMARRLQPRAERIVVVGGVGPNDSVSVAAAVNAVGALRDTLALTILSGLSLDGVLDSVARVPRQSIVVFANFRLDARGQAFDPLDVVDRVARASPAPVYAQLRSFVGEGIVGGSVTSFHDEGIRTADLIARVLRRRPGEPMPPVEPIANSFVADWRQLRRWHLSEANLPAGTEVLFREPTLWQRYRSVVLLAGAVVVVEALLIGLLLFERRRRKRAQLALDEQAAYEQAMARLTADAARYAPDDTPRALDDALARIATYASATSATLVHYSELPDEPPTQLSWSAAAEDESPVARLSGSRELPLIVDGALVGIIELYGVSDDHWRSSHGVRLKAASEIVAGAIARARTVRAIRREEELNRAVLTSLSSPIAILDRHGTIIRVNDAWREIARWTALDQERDAFVGWNYLDECQRAVDRGCDEAVEVRDGIQAVLDGRMWPFRHEYHESDREDRWYELFVDRLRLSEGGAIVTHVDITERRLAEQRADEARRQVAHMGRAALVCELTATISHELRQPLAAIRANADAGAMLAARSPHARTELREIFADIIADDCRAVQVIEGVRTLLRKEGLVATPVDLDNVCRDAARLLKHEATLRHTRLELLLDPAPLTVEGDAVQLQQVVLNLMLNALEAASLSTKDRSVVVQAASHSDHVELAVRDSGLGVPPNAQSRIFESFFSTKPNGLGLGLAIVHSIVERHNGQISFENDPLGGAVFRVRLPALPGVRRYRPENESLAGAAPR